MRGPIPQRMIGQELFQNDNLICIFTQKIKLFWLKKYDQGFTGFPLGLEKWEGIFQSGKSQGILTRLEKSGKITQNTGKLRKFQTNVICY